MSPLGLLVERNCVEFEPMVDQSIAKPPRDLRLQSLDVFRLELDHFAGAQIDKMIVVAVGHLLVTCAPVAKVVAFDDAGILEQPYRPVDRGNRDAVVDRGATPVELLDVGMIVGGGEY